MSLTEFTPPVITIGDVITASGIDQAPQDEAKFAEVLRLHQLRVPGEEELLEGRNGNGNGTGHLPVPETSPHTLIIIRPGDRKTDPLIAKHLETGYGATTELSRKIISDDKPFVATTYDFLRKERKPLEKGRLQFTSAVHNGQRFGARDEGLVQKWVFTMPLERLAEIDMVETVDRIPVARWAGGRVLPVTCHEAEMA